MTEFGHHTTQESDSRAAAIMDGEKTGLLIRAGVTMLDKMYLHGPVADIDTHISVTQHVTPGRVFLGSIAALSVRNAYRRFRSDPEETFEFEEEMEHEELPEIEGTDKPEAA